MNSERSTRAANTAHPVERLLATIGERRAWLAAGMGAAIGLDVGVLWELGRLILTPAMELQEGMSSSPVSVIARAMMWAVLGAALGFVLTRLRRTRAVAIADMERLVPSSRNLLVTALETPTTSTREREPSFFASQVHELVAARAARLASTVNVATVLPWHRVRRALAVSLLLWGVALVATQLVPRGAAARGVRQVLARATGAISISRIDVTITPPRYTGMPAQVLRDPTRIEAIEGSALTIRATSSGDSLLVTTDSGEVYLPRRAGGDFTWSGTVQRDGFLSFSPHTGTASGALRLVAISMRRDAPPVARIAQPNHDLVVDSVRPAPAVSIEAHDDIGLRSLELHLTKVSGSGERFTFEERTIPVQLTRSATTAWQASARLPLDSLLGEPGDLVVYRARVTDARPGSAPVESDAFIAERNAAGGIAAAGFALDPDEDRYAVSQQMVLLKSERLLAAKPTMAPETYEEQSRQLAVEQRRVRAEFVFMMGGEFEQAMIADEDGVADLDETHEAESETDLAAGRMVNRGRAALLTAIRAMSRAALTLNSQDLPTAIGHEKTALANLQEAFARQRFLMRALTQREALDMSRRLSGTLDSIARAPLPTPIGEVVAQRVAVRAILDSILQSGSAPREQAKTDDSRFQRLALRVLQLDAGSTRAQRIAGWLQQASGGAAASRVARDSATLELSHWLGILTRAQSMTTPPASERAIHERLDPPRGPGAR